MKRSRLQPSSILNRALVVALAVTVATTSRSQPQITAAQLASLTPVALTNCLSWGNYYFLHGPDPDLPYPPLPAAPRDLPGETPVYDLGGGYFLIDDSAVDWSAVRQQEEIDSALSDLEVQYGLRAAPAGGGLLRPMDLSSYTILLKNPNWPKINTKKDHQNTLAKNQNRLHAICGRYLLGCFQASRWRFQERGVVQQNLTRQMTSGLRSPASPTTRPTSSCIPRTLRRPTGSMTCS